MNIRQRFAKLNSYKNKLLKYNPHIPNISGIYILVRKEDGFKYAYIGQAKHILTRLAEHLMGYQHIDNSLRNHGLYAEDNKGGWQIEWIPYPESELNEKEKMFIRKYAEAGYQLRNKTAGGQDKGKFAIAEQKSPKGYRDGVEYGEIKSQRKVKEYFDKYLDYSIKGKPNKVKERKFAEFGEYIGGTYETKGTRSDSVEKP